ncbi:MAG: DNA gyrase subunit A [Candidatus Peribacteraceae bacterium]
MAESTPKNDNSEALPLPTNLGNINARPIVTEMEESYLSYAMSVIVARALPDARDGLKPVHRRILYAMNELGLRSSSKFRKSALVVGDVLGKYHPHGDSPVYEAMVRMAQDFAMRYPLVHGQGNFGSIDGDNAAAMRYTEAKLFSITDQMLQDIDKETVEFRPNYDGSRKEPSVLPSKLPNLLLNGTVGIAVGMATNIPPHNLRELTEAILHLTDNPEASVEDLLKFVKGPDFPTAGVVYGKNALRQAYTTGRGSIIIRGRAVIEEDKNRHIIRISELPYQVNKSVLIERIATLVTDKVIQGISDIRDESDRKGIRIIIELKRDSYPQKILNQLFKHTDLQTSFGYNCIALADGLQPRLLNLQELLQIFIEHRRTVITRRVTFDRDRAKERAHILEGLTIALDNIDAVIKTIKESDSQDDARTALIKKFKLSEIQANAILEMQLRRLAGLERKKIQDELKETLAFIKECEAILKDKKRIDAIMKTELGEITQRFGDERRTQIIAHEVGEFSAKDTIPNSPMVVTLTTQGYVKRLSPQQFRAQHRGGKGVKGMTTKEEDEIMCIISVQNHDDMLYFTTSGRVFSLPVYELPQASRTAKGQAIVNLLQLQPGEKVAAMMKAKLEGKTHLFMTTVKGTVKRTELSEFQNIRRSGLISQKVPTGDELKWVVATSGKDEIFILSKKGKSIRFHENDVRPMGRAAAGVRGIRLGAGDHVVEAAVVSDPAKDQLLVVMENGLGKATPVDLYRLQGRGGTGVKAAQLTPKTGDIVGGCILGEHDKGDLICISKQGQAIRMNLSDIPSRGRATQGVIVMRLDAKDKVASMSVIMLDPSEIGAVSEDGEDGSEEEVMELDLPKEEPKATTPKAAKVASKAAAPKGKAPLKPATQAKKPFKPAPKKAAAKKRK